ncbi:MAG TPA: glycosyltransferase family 4 protein [Tepidisphaeraceae bacterium]
MRLHFVITDLQIGGTPRVVRDLAIRLRPFGFQTTVTCLAPWGPVADELTSAGVPVHAVGVTRPTQLPTAVRAVRRLTEEADVVFSFLVHANSVAALALRGRRTPLLQAIQTTQPYPAWHWWAQGLAAARATRVVVPSASVARVAENGSGVSPERIVVIPNAVDVPAAQHETHRAGRWRVGFVGRLDPIKRVPDLIEAMALLPDAELHVYGDGPERSAIEATVDRFALQDRVTLHGTVASSADALMDIDTLVLPSDAEGFGLVLIEAMAAGVPVIGTDVAGIRDVISPERNGLRVPPRTPSAIAAAVNRLRHDAALHLRLTAAGRMDVRERYAWESILPRYAALIRSAVADSRSEQNAD